MQPVRQTVFGPKRGQVTVIHVSTAGVHVDLEYGAYAALLAQIQANKPLLITAETNPVYYLWSDRTSGESVDPAAGSTGWSGGFTGVAAVCFAGVNPDQLEIAPRTSRGLVLRASGGTATLRIWSGEA